MNNEENPILQATGTIAETALFAWVMWPESKNSKKNK